MDFADDLPILYADFGVEVACWPKAGGPKFVGRAIFDRPGMVVIGGEILATDYSLRFPSGTFTEVRRGDTFVIDGVEYVAREQAQPMLDGLEFTVPLARS